MVTKSTILPRTSDDKGNSRGLHVGKEIVTIEGGSSPFSSVEVHGQARMAFNNDGVPEVIFGTRVVVIDGLC